MFYLYTLLALAVIAAAVHLSPLKAKAWTALAIVAAAGIPLAVKAAGVLSGGGTCRLWAFDSLMLGPDSGSLDTLSALFVQIGRAHV